MEQDPRRSDLRAFLGKKKRVRFEDEAGLDETIEVKRRKFSDAHVKSRELEESWKESEISVTESLKRLMYAFEQFHRLQFEDGSFSHWINTQRSEICYVSKRFNDLSHSSKSVYWSLRKGADEALYEREEVEKINRGRLIEQKALYDSKLQQYQDRLLAKDLRIKSLEKENRELITSTKNWKEQERKYKDDLTALTHKLHESKVKLKEKTEEEHGDGSRTRVSSAAKAGVLTPHEPTEQERKYKAELTALKNKLREYRFNLKEYADKEQCEARARGLTPPKTPEEQSRREVQFRDTELPKRSSGGTCIDEKYSSGFQGSDEGAPVTAKQLYEPPCRHAAALPSDSGIVKQQPPLVPCSVKQESVFEVLPNRMQQEEYVPSWSGVVFEPPEVATLRAAVQAIAVSISGLVDCFARYSEEKRHNPINTIWNKHFWQFRRYDEGDWKFEIASYFCEVMFSGFDFKGFAVSRLKCFHAWCLDVTSNGFSEASRAEDSISLFKRFCKHTFHRLFPSCPLVESPDLNVEGENSGLEKEPTRDERELSRNFALAARHIWSLQEYSQTLSPPASILIANKGMKVDTETMESLYDVSSEVEPTVAYTVVPGFRAGKNVIKCQIYPAIKH